MKLIKNIKYHIDKEINIIVADYLKELKNPSLKKTGLKAKMEMKIMQKALNEFSDKDLKLMVRSKCKKKFDKKIEKMKIDDTLTFMDGSKIIKKEDGFYKL